MLEKCIQEIQKVSLEIANDYEKWAIETLEKAIYDEYDTFIMKARADIKINIEPINEKFLSQISNIEEVKIMSDKIDEIHYGIENFLDEYHVELPSTILVEKILNHFNNLGVNLVYQGLNIKWEIMFDAIDFFYKLEELEDKIVSPLEEASDEADSPKDLVGLKFKIKLTEKELRLKESLELDAIIERYHKPASDIEYIFETIA